MREEIIKYVREHDYLQKYLRINPIWYRKLNRSPESLQEFVSEARNYYQLTLPHRIDKASRNLQLAGMLLNLMQVKKE